MTKAELREAAERALKLNNKDVSAVCEAYLAEHPADDSEAVTEEWLQSVGFTENDDWYGGVKHPDGSIVIEGRSVHWSTEDNNVDCITSVTSRYDVRLLCKAFGIKLTE